MDEQRLVSHIVGEVNDQIAVRQYGHGLLVALPHTYYDDDRVTLFVEPYEGGYRVTDRGSTAVRLHMAGLNLEGSRVEAAWRRSITGLNLFNPSDEEFELAHFTDFDHIGESVLKVAEASCRIDQLRWLVTDRTPVRFRDKVVQRLSKSASKAMVVQPNAPLRLRYGKTRHVTASVHGEGSRQVFVQAVGGANTEAREQAVEHCSFLFGFAEDVPPDGRVAVLAGAESDWSDYYIETLKESSTVAFFEEPLRLETILHEKLQAAAPC